MIFAWLEIVCKLASKTRFVLAYMATRVKLSRSSGKNQEEQIGRLCPGAVLVERYLLALRGRHGSLFSSQRSHRKKLMPAGFAAQSREPEDSPEYRCPTRHTRGRDAPQCEVAANPAMGIEEGAKWHQAGVKSRLAGCTAPRQHARETEEIVQHRPASGTPAVRTMANRTAYRAGADRFSPRQE